MTAAEMREALAQLGLTQGAAARRLKVDPRTLRRWVAGSLLIPDTVAEQVRAMVGEQHGRNTT